MKTIKLGAVIYAPQVTVIWGIIADFFKENGLNLEPVFFKDYKMQVDALLKGEIDIAWNSPLAYLDAFLRSKGSVLNSAMRDTDNDRCSYLVTTKEIVNLSDLKGKKIGFGAFDSPQARLIPINHLHLNGLEFGSDYEEVRFDIGVGLHGDHVGGELDAFKALEKGEVAASWMLDMNYERWTGDGTLDKDKFIVLDKTALFDHCIFNARSDFDKNLLGEFERVLFLMDYNNPKHKEMMDLEGLKKWVNGRTKGFAQITQANEYLNFFGY